MEPEPVSHGRPSPSLQIASQRLRSLSAQAPGLAELLSAADAARANPAAADIILELIATFRDERGHRRLIDAPLLHHTLRIPPRTLPPRGSPLRSALDTELWWGLHDPTFNPCNVLKTDTGSLTGDDSAAAIETATQTELAALHALSHFAARDHTLQPRLISAAEWLIASLQPDNATNHPWATHVFLRLEAQGNIDAGLYAQTLVHNAMVSLGRPERFGAVLLLDASRALTESSNASPIPE